VLVVQDEGEIVTKRGSSSPVVVGFDGTEAARAAVSVAAGEAKLRGSGLRIVHVVQVAPGSSPAPGIPRGEVEANLAEDAAEWARVMLPEDRIDVETVDGWALDELLDRSVGAAMLVLGRGHPGSMGVLLGSIALGATTRASCPVLVVGAAMGGAVLSEGLVVVGVDGAEDSELALEEAFSAAHLRGAQLVVIHTWRHFVSSGRGDGGSLSRDPLGLDTDRAGDLRATVAPFRARFPLVEVTEQLVEGTAARVLVESAARAALLVVGTRGRGPITGLLLGSVGQHVVAHARCPVLVARPRESSAPATRTRPSVSRLA
jgi:nucleotide-binding universal stress UspA family protein